jgi:hypothetical protein
VIYRLRGEALLAGAAPILGWFQEGSDTADPQALDELGHSAALESAG